MKSLHSRHYRLTMEFSFLLSVTLTAVSFHFLRFPDVISRPQKPIEREPMEMIPITEILNKTRLSPPRRPVAIAERFAEQLLEDPSESIDSTIVPDILVVESPVEPIIESVPFITSPEVDPSIIGGEAFVRKHMIYPDVARMARREGLAIVKVYLDEAGNVLDAEIVQETGNVGFGQAALDVLRKCRFTPALQRDRPVRVAVNIPIRFRLK